MKRKTLKRLATVVAAVSLFSTTLAYGDNMIPYTFTLNPTQIAYTNTTEKAVEGRYAIIRQTSPSSVIEYTVMSSTNIAKTNPEKRTGAGSLSLRYLHEEGLGVVLKLKVCNHPGDNNGGIRNASGTWIP